jgi:subfamily B ATP-binding cassette protein MsbA
VQEALEALMRGRTVLVIAHRLSTIRRADRIVFVAQGQVAEVGTHAELLERPGAYRRFYELQFGQGAA